MGIWIENNGTESSKIYNSSNVHCIAFAMLSVSMEIIKMKTISIIKRKWNQLPWVCFYAWCYHKGIDRLSWVVLLSQPWTHENTHTHTDLLKTKWLSLVLSPSFSMSVCAILNETLQKYQFNLNRYSFLWNAFSCISYQVKTASISDYLLLCSVLLLFIFFLSRQFRFFPSLVFHFNIEFMLNAQSDLWNIVLLIMLLLLIYFFSLSLSSIRCHRMVNSSHQQVHTF